jgi:uncharacterized membrane protein
MEAWIRLAQQKKGEPLTPNEEEAVRREHTPPSLSEQLEAAFTKQDRAQQKAAVAALQKELDDYVRLVPEQYQTAAETPSMWKALKKDAKAMAEIDEDDYNAIAGLHRQIGRYGPQLDAFLREHSPDPTRKGGVRVSPQDIETEARSLLLR